MAGRLAKLDDLKALIRGSGAPSFELDNELETMIERATSIAEDLVGRPMSRETEIVEFPRAGGRDGLVKSIHLKRPPIESIDSVIQLYSVGSDQDFTDAEGTDAELTLDADFIIGSRDLGRLDNIAYAGSAWFLARPRHLRVTYTGGYADPADDAAIADGGIVPPLSLQDGILQQALLMWSTRQTGGVREVDLGQGGRVSTTEARHHPRLVAACQQLRRLI